MEQETDTLIFPSCTYIIHLAGCEKEAELYRKELHIIDQECILYLWENQDAFSEHQPSTIPAFPNSFHFIIKCHGACKVFDMEGCYDARAENLAKEVLSLFLPVQFVFVYTSEAPQLDSLYANQRKLQQFPRDCLKMFKVETLGFLDSFKALLLPSSRSSTSVTDAPVRLYVYKKNRNHQLEQGDELTDRIFSDYANVKCIIELPKSVHKLRCTLVDQNGEVVEGEEISKSEISVKDVTLFSAGSISLIKAIEMVELPNKKRLSFNFKIFVGEYKNKVALSFEDQDSSWHKKSKFYKPFKTKPPHVNQFDRGFTALKELVSRAPERTSESQLQDIEDEICECITNCENTSKIVELINQAENDTNTAKMLLMIFKVAIKSGKLAFQSAKRHKT